MFLLFQYETVQHAQQAQSVSYAHKHLTAIQGTDLWHWVQPGRWGQGAGPQAHLQLWCWQPVVWMRKNTAQFQHRNNHSSHTFHLKAEWGKTHSTVSTQQQSLLMWLSYTLHHLNEEKHSTVSTQQQSLLTLHQKAEWGKTALFQHSNNHSWYGCRTHFTWMKKNTQQFQHNNCHFWYSCHTPEWGKTHSSFNTATITPDVAVIHTSPEWGKTQHCFTPTTVTSDMATIPCTLYLYAPIFQMHQIFSFFFTKHFIKTFLMPVWFQRSSCELFSGNILWHAPSPNLMGSQPHLYLSGDSHKSSKWTNTEPCYLDCPLWRSFCRHLPGQHTFRCCGIINW